MTVDSAKSGAEAIDLIKANHYDLVMMDHMMPEMDGIEATTQIRALGEEDDYFRNLPIIALTANAISGMKDMFLQNGMNDYLAKPIEMTKLYSLLDKWIPKANQRNYFEETATAAKPHIVIKGVDTRAGLKITGGNSEHYQYLLEIFYLDSIDKKNHIQNALKQKNLHLLIIHVHAMKSACANIGAFELSEKAQRLEMASHEKNMGYLADNIDSFLQDLSDTAEAIAAALPRVPVSFDADAGQDGQELRGLLVHLKDALVDINIEATDLLLESLRSGQWTLGAKRNLVDFDKFILLFEYEEAIKNISAMLALCNA
jgi:CheY-like chemotaxis protein